MKYPNCAHTMEPGCNVREAIEDGSFNAARLENYNKFQTEAGYD